MARLPVDAAELRAVAPLVVASATPTLVGPCTLVTNGQKTVAFAAAEMLRRAPDPLAIALTLDGKRVVRVASWALARATGLGIAELAEPLPTDDKLDVQPLQVGAVCATVETRGGPAALIAFVADGTKFVRRIVPAFVDGWDGAGMRDDVVQLASPREVTDVDVAVEGAPMFVQLPPDPVLGRAAEIVAVALALPYKGRDYKPRELPPFAELVGLEDLGRVLPYSAAAVEASNDLRQVAGEIRDDPSGPLKGLDFDDK